MKNNNSIKPVVAVGIGAALFFVLGRFVAIPSPVPNTNISLQYAVLGLLAAMYGPVAGGLIGFIGHALAKRLLEQGHEVTGIDALNEYYSPLLKRARLEDLGVEAGEFPYGGETGSRMFPAFFFSRLFSAGSSSDDARDLAL